MKTTIGGQRLGSGNKMTADLKTYERSTHDLSRIWRSTMASGTLVPFLSLLGLPGDTFDIDLNCDIKTHPTIGPLFGSYKTQLDIFCTPVRLYNAQLQNNKLGIGMKMADIKLPQIRLRAKAETTTTSSDQINPSCILNYLGIKGIGRPAVGNINESLPREFNAIPILAYWDIFKNYYANKQETKAFVVHTDRETTVETITEINGFNYGEPSQLTEYPELSAVIQTTTGITITYEIGQTHTRMDGLVFYDTAGNKYAWNALWQTENMAGSDANNNVIGNAQPGTEGININAWGYLTAADLPVTPPTLQEFDLKNIDTMREAIMESIATPGAFVISDAFPLAPYSYLTQLTDGPAYLTPLTQPQEGLAVKTYQSDLFNNWMKTDWIDGDNGISALTAIDTSDGSFTIDTLNLSKKVYDMLNRIAISGGTYDDWIETVWTNQTLRKSNTPMYMGGLSKELVFQEVVSNSQAETTDGIQPLGQLAGRGVMGQKHKGGKITIKIEEPSYIMGIISLTPRIDYSQGNSWDINLKTMDDFHKPALDEIGFQDLITDQLAWWDTKITQADTLELRSAGKQPAWLNYMTATNGTHGNFAIPTNEMFMTLNRRYEMNEVTGNIKDLTTYIDPTKYNFIFAETALDAQNFWAQIAVNITARRKMSAKIIPNL